MNTRSCALSIVLCAFAASGPSDAQVAPREPSEAAGVQLQEIVVTANRREENQADRADRHHRHHRRYRDQDRHYGCHGPR